METLRAAGAKNKDTQKTFSMRFRRQKRKRIRNVSGNVVGNALKTFRIFYNPSRKRIENVLETEFVQISSRR